MSTTKEYIGNLQRRIANQRTEIEALHSIVKRQLAEIEKLRKRIAENENGYAQTLYLERLKNRDLTEENNRLSVWEQRKVEAVRSHAIKEFAERLKKRLYDKPSIFTQQRYIVNDEIKNLAEEMTGEQI